tara:strand:+ start:11448 stop:12485 length:1038 start_codon:yes stop_codon:yes gene_type:complete
MKIGNFNLETDGVFIIAELSANHNGSLQNALKTVKAAQEAGANAIKLQTYTPDTITLKCDKEDFIVKGGTPWDNETLYNLYEKAHLPWSWHDALFKYARELNIDIFSTPFDKTAVDFLETYKPSVYKIASFEITDHELIKYTASKGRPMIISTGIATIEEIQAAVDICRKENNSHIVLLKCTSAYPAPLSEVNLKTMSNMKETFNVEVGFSDHTLGITAPVVAASLGAKIIEKHFILDKSLGGPDASFSLNPTEFKQMVECVRETEALLGNVSYVMTEKKRNSRQFARSLYVTKKIRKGDIFSHENIKSVRPGYSLHPKYLKLLLSTHASKDYDFGDRITQRELL